MRRRKISNRLDNCQVWSPGFSRLREKNGGKILPADAGTPYPCYIFQSLFDFGHLTSPNFALILRHTLCHSPRVKKYQIAEGALAAVRGRDAWESGPVTYVYHVQRG
jgi:hypothetical protein